MSYLTDEETEAQGNVLLLMSESWPKQGSDLKNISVSQQSLICSSPSLKDPGFTLDLYPLEMYISI